MSSNECGRLRVITRGLDATSPARARVKYNSRAVAHDVSSSESNQNRCLRMSADIRECVLSLAETDVPIC
jgi:hypothetical protein